METRVDCGMDCPPVTLPVALILLVLVMTYAFVALLALSLEQRP
jgi:hypothetical protein